MSETLTETWHRENLGHLYQRWEEWNHAHFEDRLASPSLLLAEPPRGLGDAGLSPGNGRFQIRLRPSLLMGTDPATRTATLEGRLRFVEDVLLHEMVHQWQREVSGKREHAYRGHGPTFRNKANEIGAALGLPAVRDVKASRGEKGLRSCAQWPQCVRPEDYYPGLLSWGVVADANAALRSLARMKRRGR